jgi:hypothetical protein
MKHIYLLLLCLFFFISSPAQQQLLFEKAGIDGACTVIPNSIDVSCFGLCDGSSIAIANGVPPFNYQWSTGATTASLSGLCAGSYTVAMTDSTGCIDSVVITITEPSAISSTIISSYLNCQCTFIPFVTGGAFPYTYLWCNNNTSPILTDCTPGLCTLNITDANGCTIQDTILITPPPAVTLTPAVIDATCNGCNDGSITANLSGGTPPYTYTLVPGGSNSTGTFSGLAAGSYTLCATDSIICTVCTTLVVNEPTSACSVAIIGVNNILCYGDCNGSLTAIANGVPPFNYSWSNGDNTATADSLCGGSYTVIMTDSVGCIETAIGGITEPLPIVSTYTSDFSNCNCVYTLTSNGGTPPYTYQWCDGSVGQSISTCQPGLCPVLVADANGCLIVDTIFMTPPPPLILTVQTTGTSCSGCSDGTVISGTSGGLPPYSYILTPSMLICDTCLNLVAGIYTLCVTDSNNCTVCVTDTVEDDPTSIAFTYPTENLRVSPNPFRDYLRVELSQELLLLHPIFVIRDVTGRIILNSKLIEQQSKLSLGDIFPGVYFYQLITDDKNELKGKLIARE